MQTKEKLPVEKYSQQKCLGIVVSTEHLMFSIVNCLLLAWDT